MQFTKLRLSGFKSFVDPVELEIETGLTGVVGPNGCGKSNLVEALRWVMGENSAKRMRGAAMDDVIFNGSQNRGSRNLAEVSLLIDNKDRSAPAILNDAEELEVTRAIEREHGSAYRVNGNEMRARDVQLLFADAASGAHSPSLVSQGRIAETISAKPADRRALLEEAAGITGLHSRRHEAELRLRAAENNMERLDDVMQSLEAQLQNMKRQARQARRFRKIGEQVRHFEAIQLHLLFRRAEQQLQTAGEELAKANTQVATLTQDAAQATTAHTEGANGLPDLRQAEAVAAAALHRLAVARDGLDQEEQRITEASARLQARLQQIEIDQARETGLGEEAAATIARLDGEAETLRGEQGDETAAEAAAEEKVSAATSVLADGEGRLQTLTDQVAESAAQAEALQRALDAAEQRLQRLSQRRTEARAVHERLTAETQVDERLGEANKALAEAEQTAEAAIAALEQSEATHAACEESLAQAREAGRQIEGQDAQLAAEEKALAELLRKSDADLWPALIDAVTVDPGYEAALGAALGDDLDVPTDEAAPVHWRTLAPRDDASDLPAGATPLSRYVQAPAALARRLSQIGVVDAGDAARLAGELAYGQRLVTVDGALWRWDGFTVTAGAETAAAVRLAQGNRLAELGRFRAELVPGLEKSRAALVAARDELEAAARHRATAREAARLDREALDQSRNAQAGAEKDAAARSARMTTVVESLTQIEADLEEGKAAMTETQEQLAALPPLDDLRRQLEALRAEVSVQRTDLVEARGQHDRLQREIKARAERLTAIAGEQEGWRRRATSAAEQLSELAERAEAGREELEQLQRKPAEIAAQRQALLGQIETAEAARNKAADDLAGAEAKVGELAAAQRRAEGALAAAREERVRAEAGVEQCEERRGEVSRRILEALDCQPQAVLASVDIDAEAELPPLEEAERKLERLKRERDNMGAVNLRAEQEAVELQEQLEGMVTERADLEAAIARLRQGIYSLNKEARERLLGAFKTVDGHFQDLFVRLFGGGKAHLSLTESDDPLEAGLEIMASPPGKRLQTLSLLSGGEQTLAALALLFAVFLTNPAPVCVLDEVDAPLDDANVERFTNLVGEIARVTGTRFLIITHHPYTMARMDRLFGVTMSERGVSQLVSVDLARAERIRATA
ncbi:MAG: chromosome segregation protein SMC [Alphaproteobacteria bacterium]|nr:chromosome segregation protein SMC [Alphaproteobacteria bacterium]